ncbi:MAG: hypothetical protein PHC33_00280 [Candidatus Omnitrophica bacterium]|nr:hypothetical protein [Candidatus Omnitrophota bacterium]
MKFGFLIVSIFLCLSAAVPASVQAEEAVRGDAEMPAALTPETTQVEGVTAATLGPAKYPMFYDYQSNDSACGDYLKKQFKVKTGDEDDGTANSGMSLAPIYLQSQNSTNGWSGGQKVDYVQIPGLELKGYKIPEEYRKKAGILVTWTVRIESSRTAPYQVQDNLCSGDWEGTSYQGFPSGEVKTKLFVTSGAGTGNEKTKSVGPEACMTIPDGGKTEITEVKKEEEPPESSEPTPRSSVPIVPPASSYTMPPGDPTHTGSYLITPADYDGLLPAALDLEIRWINETSQQITSPAKMRSMIVTLMPEAEQANK